MPKIQVSFKLAQYAAPGLKKLVSFKSGCILKTKGIYEQTLSAIWHSGWNLILQAHTFS